LEKKGGYGLLQIQKFQKDIGDVSVKGFFLFGVFFFCFLGLVFFFLL